MRQRSFKCHCCDQVIIGPYQFALAFQLGFVWNREKFDQPAWYFDICRECEHTFARKYREGQEERRAQVEARLLATWQKRFGLDSTMPERRKVKMEASFTRRSGDQFNLFNHERNLCQDHQPHSAASLRGLAHPVIARRLKTKAGVRSAALVCA